MAGSWSRNYQREWERKFVESPVSGQMIGFLLKIKTSLLSSYLPACDGGLVI